MEYAFIGVIGANTIINVVAHSASVFEAIRRWWIRLNRYSRRVLRHNNQHIYRLLTEIVNPYCLNLRRAEVITLEYAWDGKENKNKIFYIPERNIRLIIQVDAETQIELYRYSE